MGRRMICSASFRLEFLKLSFAFLFAMVISWFRGAVAQ